jgi:hypothetical protein
MQGTWDASEKAYATMFGGEKVPQGVYNMRLSKCHLKTANASGNPYLGREFTILDGESAGAKVYARIMLHNETGPVFARKFIVQCGFEVPKSFSDLPSVAEDIENAEIDLQGRVTYNGDFPNVEVMSLITQTDEEETTPDVDGNFDALATLADSWGVPAYDTYDSLKEGMLKFSFEVENLSADEIELLEKNDLGSIIVRPETKPKKSTPGKKK